MAIGPSRRDLARLHQLAHERSADQGHRQTRDRQAARRVAEYALCVAEG